MNTVKVRNLELGNGIPAICIPNVGKTKEDILSLTRTYLGMHMDLMEWRMDWYEDVEDIAKVSKLVKELRDVMGDTPLLCYLPYRQRRRRTSNVHRKICRT